MAAPLQRGTPPRLSREEAMAKAQANLKAKARENRQKSSLVLSVSAVAFLVPAALFAGLDFSGWLYPAEVAEPGAQAAAEPAPESVVGSGSQVTLSLEGRLDNGTLFLPNGTANATIGAGDLVPGLDRALIGLREGETFNLTVLPADGFGNWSTSRTYHIEPTEGVRRNTTMEVGNFDDRWGSPQVGQVVPTSVWPSRVASIHSDDVHLQYMATEGEVVRYHKYWDSKVIAVSNSTITVENMLYVGYTYNRTNSAGTVLHYVLTRIDSRGYLFDRNPPLAGQTLHYTGRVVATEGGLQGAPPPSSAAAPSMGRPVNMGGQDCARCHGSFRPLTAAATAQANGTGLRVDVAIADPWRHDLTNVAVAATDFEANATLATDAQLAPDIGAGKSRAVSLTLAEAPVAEGTVQVVVDVTAHHVHRSPGRHDDNKYRLTLEIPVRLATMAAAPAAAADALLAMPQGPDAPPTAAEYWGWLGQWAGFVALVSVFLPATQGLRRHVGAKPLFRAPPWLTAHFAMSLAVTAASAFHAVALMSSTYHGAWTWDVWAGVAGLVVLGAFGVTGVVLAKWTRLRSAKVKRVHYALLTAFIFAGALHVLASSTTLRWVLGA